MAILISVLSALIVLIIVVLFLNKVADYQFPPELELGWQSKKQKRQEKLLSKLNIIRLGKTNTGSPKIILGENQNYKGFEIISAKFIKATFSRIDNKAESPMERVWTVTIQGVPCCLSWDDLSRDVSIFAWDPSGNEFIEKVFGKIMELQLKANARL